jgi:acetolactate synthase-1/3 small subunit
MSKISTAEPLSPYSSATAKANIETHTLSVLVDNEPGVLARVVGMFAGRGYNIESLTVAEVAHETHLSRITIVTSGTPEIIEQIRHQLERLVPVHSVKDLTLTVRAIERELAMIKVRGKGENRVEAMRLADAFRAKVIDATTESFIFELTGAPRKIDDFVELMRPLGLVEVSRTGVAAISRGPEPIFRSISSAGKRKARRAGATATCSPTSAARKALPAARTPGAATAGRSRPRRAAS